MSLIGNLGHLADILIFAIMKMARIGPLNTFLLYIATANISFPTLLISSHLRAPQILYCIMGIFQGRKVFTGQ